MRNKTKRRIQRYTFFILIVILLFCSLLTFWDHRFLPLLKEISHLQCKNQINMIINHAITEQLPTLKSEELLMINGDTYVANTELINRFCTDISIHITEELQKYPREMIRIPLGAATGFSLLANKGPSISFTLQPMSAVKTDYKTGFTSAGINQINYKIWLNLSLDMKVVNPLYQEMITLSRKIMLCDLVFSGKVPEHYSQISSLDEYLLTE